MRVEYNPETGHYDMAADQGKPGDFGKACFMIFGVLIAFVAVWSGLQWAAQQAWIGYAVQWVIGGAVALFVLFAVISGVLKAR